MKCCVTEQNHGANVLGNKQAEDIGHVKEHPNSALKPVTSNSYPPAARGNEQDAARFRKSSRQKSLRVLIFKKITHLLIAFNHR